MNIGNKLLCQIDAYAKEAEESRSSFGLRVMGSPNWVHNLALGKGSLRSIEKAIVFLKEHGYEV